MTVYSWEKTLEVGGIEPRTSWPQAYYTAIDKTATKAYGQVTLKQYRAGCWSCCFIIITGSVDRPSKTIAGIKALGVGN